MKRCTVLFFVFVLLFNVLFQGMPVNAETSSGSRNLVDLQVFKDTIDARITSVGGKVENIEGNIPVDGSQMYNGLPSIKLNVIETVDSFDAFLPIRNWNTTDLTQYVQNGYLEFNIKGKTEDLSFRIGAIDKQLKSLRGTDNVSIVVKSSDYFKTTTNWSHVKIPLKDIMNTEKNFEPKEAWGIVISEDTKSPFTLWFNDIKITSSDKEKTFPHIKVNQLGFLPNSEKYAFVTGFQDELPAASGSVFEVRRVSDNKVCYSGTLSLVTDLDSLDSGERIFKADFSNLTTEGEYYVAVSSITNEKSAVFNISKNLYDSLLVDSSRYFYYHRTGDDLVSPCAGDFARKDPYPGDKNAVLGSDSETKMDVSGGWYNSNDSAKYVNTGACTVADMLWAYETYPSSFNDKQSQIPESGNNIPDILDEARWEIEWILKMQDSESGGFYSSVQSVKDNVYSDRLIMDAGPNGEKVLPTNDTACAASMLAHAYDVYKQYDKAFADSCLKAAEKAWTYLEKNPSDIFSPILAYRASSDKDSRLCAAASLFKATADEKYNTYFKNNYVKYDTKFEDTVAYSHTFEDMWLPAFFYYISSTKADVGIRDWFCTEYGKWLSTVLDRYYKNPWNNAVIPGKYYWGMNGVVAGVPMDALIGTRILGIRSKAVEQFALNSLGWLLGANPINKSFISGYGKDSVSNIYDPVLINDELSTIPKGYMAGGPNKFEGAGISRYAAKCYIDSYSDKSTNENILVRNSPLVFLSAMGVSKESEPVESRQLTGDVNGDWKVNSIDMSYMKRYILGMITSFPVTDSVYGSVYGGDLSGDFKVNSQDFSYLKKYLLGQIKVFPADAKKSGVIYTGRFDFSDPKGPRFGWMGSSIKTCFDGTEISVNLKSTGENWFEVIVDNIVQDPVKVKGLMNVKLISGIAPGTHTVEIVKRTEPMYGEVQFLGFDAGSGNIFYPGQSSERRIEFIGDSITCGLGNEACDQNQAATAANENGYMSYAPITARNIEADAAMISYSGRGLTTNYGGGTGGVMPALYKMTLPSDGANTWDFSKWTPQVIVINLGTNDFSKDIPDTNTFISAYVNLIKDIRVNNKTAHIYCVQGPMLNGSSLAAARYFITSAVNQMNSSGDSLVHYFEFAPQTGADGYGAAWHPNIVTHKKMSDQLTEQIKNDLKW